jgi:hypothetical protein
MLREKNAWTWQKKAGRVVADGPKREVDKTFKKAVEGPFYPEERSRAIEIGNTA